MEEPGDNNSFLVKPGTDEYEVTSFLVRNRKNSFTPPEIASSLNIDEDRASKVLSHLFEQKLVNRSQESYYVGSENAKHLQRRLKSVDSAERLHNTTPDDDAYAEGEWEDDLASR